MIGALILYVISFSAEAITAWLYFDFLLSKKKSVQFTVVVFAGGYSFLFAISRLDNTTLNAIAFCLVNFALILLGYECNRKTALLHTTFLCFLMVGSEIIINLIFNLFGFEFSAFTYNYNVMIMLAILSKLLYLGFSTIGSRKFAPHKHKAEEPQMMILFCTLPLLSAAIAIAMAYWGMVEGINGPIGIMTIVIVITLLVVNLIALVLYKYLQKTNEEYLTLQLSIQKEQADIAYYKALQEQFENHRILIHDIRNHLNTIGTLSKQSGDSEVEVYVS